MRLRPESLNEKTETLVGILGPLGFQCVGICLFMHEGTGELFDFSAHNLELKDLICGMLNMVKSRNFNRGHITARKQLAEFLDVTYDEESHDNAASDGRLPPAILGTM